jgi:hypothetical protein
MDDHQLTLTDRRHRHAVGWMLLRGRSLPHEPSGCGFECGERAGHAEREQPAVVEEGCGLGSFAVRRRQHVRLVRRRVTRVPAFPASRGVEGRHHLVAVAPGEHVDSVGHDEGRGVSLSNVDFPPSGQRLGPRRRLSERAGRAIPVHAAPLWIVPPRVLRGGRGDAGHHEGAAQAQPAPRTRLSTCTPVIHVGEDERRAAASSSSMPRNRRTPGMKRRPCNLRPASRVAMTL